MDLVGRNGEVVLHDDGRDSVELVAGERPSARVVWVAPQQQASVARRSLERVDIEPASLVDRPERGFDDATPVLDDRGQERRIDRSRDEHAVARLGERDDRVDHTPHHVRELEAQLVIGLEPEPAPQTSGAHRLDRVRTVVGRIPVVALGRDRR